MRAFESSSPLVHVDVDDLRAVLDLLTGDVQRLVELAFLDQAQEAGGSGDVGALADVDEQGFVVDVAGLEPRELQRRTGGGDLARVVVGHGFRERADVFGRCPAAAADHVQPARPRPATDLVGHLPRRLVVTAEGVRQPRVRVGAGEGVGEAGELLDVGAKLLGTEGTVEADEQRLRVSHRVPERLERLTREGAARGVGDRARDRDGQSQAALVEHAESGEDRRLRVERVEHGLDKNQIDPALDQRVAGLEVGGVEILEGDVAKARVGDVGGERGGAVGRPEDARDEARAIRCAGGGGVGGLAGQARAFDVQLAHQGSHVVVGHRHGVGVEGVGLDDVGTGVEVGGMDAADQLGPGQRQQVVVALQVRRPVGEARAAEVRLRERVLLDHRAHRAVEQQDAAFELLAQERVGRMYGKAVVHRRRRSGDRIGRPDYQQSINL